ncbi:MAG: hypothetical protein VX498_11265, partial [Myxococcota bacterium]|nr:hypothetical protein [Myxococcota bacterium]
MLRKLPLLLALLVSAGTALAEEPASRAAAQESRSSEADDAASPLKPPFALPPQFPPRAVHDVLSPGQDKPGEAPQPADFSIIYEGATGGISGASTDLYADTALARAFAGKEGLKWSRKTGGWGAFLRGGRWLLLPEGGVRTFREAVAPGLLSQPDRAALVTGLVADDYLVVAWPPEPAAAVLPVLERALGSDPLRPPPVPTEFHVEPHTTESSEALVVSRSPRQQPLQFPLDPEVWETRLRTVFSVETEAGTAQVQVIGRLEGEGARRTALVRQWRRAPSLYLSAGESVEGRSYLPGEQVSLQRPATWAQWKTLQLTALAPGEAELAAGLEALRTEAEEAGAALVSVNLKGSDGEHIFAPWVLREVAGRRVVLMGWTKPAIYPELPPGVRQSVRIEGVTAVHEALTKLEEELDSPPELVVLFGVGAQEIAGNLPGIDIVLGDFSTRLRLARWVEVGEGALRARSEEHPRARAPALVSRLGGHMVGRIDLAFDEESTALSRLRHLRARIAEEHPVDENSVRAIQAIRQEVYASLETPLVPDLGSIGWKAPRKGQEAPPDQLDRRALVRLSANLLMDRTGAGLALLRPLPHSVVVPGETAELPVDATLSVLDEVVLIELTGAELKRILRTVRPRLPQPGGTEEGGVGLWGWVAGAKLAGTKLTVRGRPVADGDVLRLATTDFFADDPALTAALKKARMTRHFGPERWQRRAVPVSRGSVWRLHDLVKGGLTRLRDGGAATNGAAEPRWNSDGATYRKRLRPLLLDQSGLRAGRLSVELDGLALQVTGSIPVGERDAYSEATESRVHQSEAMNLSARGRIATVWDDRIGSVTGYGEFAFGEQRIPDGDE